MAIPYKLSTDYNLLYKLIQAGYVVVIKNDHKEYCSVRKGWHSESDTEIIVFDNYLSFLTMEFDIDKFINRCVFEGLFFLPPTKAVKI